MKLEFNEHRGRKYFLVTLDKKDDLVPYKGQHLRHEDKVYRVVSHESVAQIAIYPPPPPAIFCVVEEL